MHLRGALGVWDAQPHNLVVGRTWGHRSGNGVGMVSHTRHIARHEQLRLGSWKRNLSFPFACSTGKVERGWQEACCHWCLEVAWCCVLCKYGAWSGFDLGLEGSCAYCPLHGTNKGMRCRCSLLRSSQKLHSEDVGKLLVPSRCMYTHTDTQKIQRLRDEAEAGIQSVGVTLLLGLHFSKAAPAAHMLGGVYL